MTSSSTGAVVAAIDIGSNSIKMTIGRPDGQGGVEQFDWMSEVVRLGQNLDRTGRLDPERIDVAVETLARFASRARELGATRVVAVATEATRAATNGTEFLDRVRRVAGIEVRAVDGQEEARLTFRGVAATIEITSSALIADIGGGSTELIAARGGAMVWAESIPLGSGRLTDRFVANDPPLADELVACESESDRVIEGVTGVQELRAGTGARLIVVGGTGEYLARLVPAQEKIELKDVRSVLARLSTISAAELAAEIAVPESRARVLPAGIAIVAAIASRLKPDRIEVAQSGIRTGLLLDVMQSPGADADTRASLESAVNRPTGTKALKTGAQGNGQQAGPDSNFREAMKALITERWDAVWRTIPVALEGTDIEGVHDVRVASRRLRAAMDIAAPIFPHGWYRSLHRSAKEITGALGEVRDRDVLLESLRAERKSAPLAEQPGIDRLIARVEREHAEARVDMERFLDQLLAGPVRNEVTRRFGMTQATRDSTKMSAGESK